MGPRVTEAESGVKRDGVFLFCFFCDGDSLVVDLTSCRIHCGYYSAQQEQLHITECCSHLNICVCLGIL